MERPSRPLPGGASKREGASLLRSQWCESAAKAEHPRCPNRPASGSRFQARFRSPRADPVGPRGPEGAFLGREEGTRVQRRNKRAAKPMKTNDLAKSLIPRPNDFNSLHPETEPLVSFGAIFVSFGAFGLRGRQERNGPAASPPPAPLPRLGGRPGKPSALVEANGRFGARGRRDRESLDLGPRGLFEKRGRLAGARPKKLRKRAAKFMKSLVPVTLCAARGRVAASPCRSA